jgi:hypothetical protein
MISSDSDWMGLFIKVDEIFFGLNKCFDVFIFVYFILLFSVFNVFLRLILLLFNWWLFLGELIKFEHFWFVFIIK